MSDREDDLPVLRALGPPAQTNALAPSTPTSEESSASDDDVARRQRRRRVPLNRDPFYRRRGIDSELLRAVEDAAFGPLRVLLVGATNVVLARQGGAHNNAVQLSELSLETQEAQTLVRTLCMLYGTATRENYLTLGLATFRRPSDMPWNMAYAIDAMSDFDSRVYSTCPAACLPGLRAIWRGLNNQSVAEFRTVHP
jgi:hypothetical protein